MNIKQVIMSLAALVLIAGCDTTFEGGEFRVKSFTSEGCANHSADVNTADETSPATLSGPDTKGFPASQAGTLRLKHEDGCLKIILNGLEDGCEITHGFDCTALLEDTNIYVNVTIKTTDVANCFCRLDDTETVISGLEQGKYTLIYNYKSVLKDITETVTFNYDATLNKSISFPRN